MTKYVLRDYTCLVIKYPNYTFKHNDKKIKKKMSDYISNSNYLHNLD